jgi:hypothetical protein
MKFSFVSSFGSFLTAETRFYKFGLFLVCSKREREYWNCKDPPLLDFKTELKM